MKGTVQLLAILLTLALAGCGGGKSGGNNLGITGYTFEDVVGAMGETAKINDRYIATWPGFEILPGGGTRRMNLQMPATVDGFAVDPRATLIDVNASGQFLAELFLPDSPEYSMVAALLSEGEPIILPYPPGYRQRNPDQIQPNILAARGINNASQALVTYGGTEGGLYFVSPNSIERSLNFGILSANGQFFGNDFVAPFQFIDGAREPILTPPDGLDATIWAVSDNGTVAGLLRDVNFLEEPESLWVWSRSKGIKYTSLEGRRGVVIRDVNDTGVVIGSFLPEDQTDPGTKPFLIIEGRFIELSSLKIMPSGTSLRAGQGINNSNIISQDAGGLKIGRPVP